MSLITLAGNAAGTGTFVIASPNSNDNRTLNLPDASTTLVGTDAAQTLSNKTITGSTMQGGTMSVLTATPSSAFFDSPAIPSWARRVTAVFTALSTTVDANVRFQLGDAGGVEVTGYSGSTTVLGNSTGVTTQLSAGFDQASTAGAAFGVTGQITFTHMGGNTWVAVAQFGGAGVAGMYWIAGSKTLSDVLTFIRVTTVAGTASFDAGAMNFIIEG